MDTAMADGPATAGMARGTMNGSPSGVSPSEQAVGRGEYHADGDQEQYDGARDADGLLSQVQQVQQIAAAIEKQEQYAQRNQQFSRNNPLSPLRIHVFQHGEKNRHVTQGVHDQEQGQGRGECIHVRRLPGLFTLTVSVIDQVPPDLCEYSTNRWPCLQNYAGNAVQSAALWFLTTRIISVKMHLPGVIPC
jgi:hypothetical protein